MLPTIRARMLIRIFLLATRAPSFPMESKSITESSTSITQRRIPTGLRMLQSIIIMVAIITVLGMVTWVVTQHGIMAGVIQEHILDGIVGQVGL